MITDQYELQVISVCYSDYFRGYHNPVIAVPVHKDLTADDFRDDILTEYHSTWDHLCYDNAWPDIDDTQFLQLVDHLLLVSGDEPVTPNANPLPDPDVDDDWDTWPTEYAYIACVKKD